MSVNVESAMNLESTADCHKIYSQFEAFIAMHTDYVWQASTCQDSYLFVHNGISQLARSNIFMQGKQTFSSISQKFNVRLPVSVLG